PLEGGHAGVDRRGAAAGEDDLVRIAADQAGDLAAGHLDPLARLPPLLVNARRVAAAGVERLDHGGAHPRVERGGGVVVEVDAAASARHPGNLTDPGPGRHHPRSVPDDPGSMLVDAGLIGADQLAWARAARAEVYQARLRVPRVSEEELAGIGPAVLRRIPADMAAELRVLPVAADGEQNLTVAMSDPSDQHAVDEVAFFTGCYVVRAVATQAQIAWGLAHYYGVMTPLWTGGQDPGGEAAEGGVPAAVLEEAPTGPSRARTVRQPVIDPDALELELELAPRSGEITAQAPPREPERLPAVVVEEIE